MGARAEWECDRIIATARTDHGRGTAEESGPRRADQNKSGVSHESRTLIFKVAYTHSTTGDKSSIMTAINGQLRNLHNVQRHCAKPIITALGRYDHRIKIIYPYSVVMTVNCVRLTSIQSHLVCLRLQIFLQFLIVRFSPSDARERV